MPLTEAPKKLLDTAPLAAESTSNPEDGVDPEGSSAAEGEASGTAKLGKRGALARCDAGKCGSAWAKAGPEAAETGSEAGGEADTQRRSTTAASGKSGASIACGPKAEPLRDVN